MLQTIQIAALLGVQHELVRDAAGPLPAHTDCDGRRFFDEHQQATIREQLAKWERLNQS